MKRKVKIKYFFWIICVIVVLFAIPKFFSHTNPSKKEYRRLEAKVKKLEKEIQKLEEQIEEKQLIEGLEDYRSQVSKIVETYTPLIEYSVKNFEAKYDEEGHAWVQNMNKIDHMIGEIAKYTPWGITVNFFTSMSIASSDTYYEEMEKTNVAFSNAYLDGCISAKEVLEKFKNRLNFYVDLTEEKTDIQEEFHNLQLLNYLNKTNKIDVSEYAEEVYKQLYILAAQMKSIGDLYGILLTDYSAYNEFNQQYEELMQIIDAKEGEKIKATQLNEELSEYLIPIFEAGRWAIDGLQEVSRLADKTEGLFYMYPSQLGGNSGCRVGYCSLKNRMAHYMVGSYLDIYYSLNGPFWIYGEYIFEDIVLNRPEADGKTVLEEALWLRNICDKNVQNNFYPHYQKMLTAISGKNFSN